MNIREISDVFKDTAADIIALKSYNFGWPSDRVRQGNTEDYQELNEFPRVFFSVPTITASNQIRKQDTYQITLFFDDLLGYDNEGDADLTLQIDKWALLQNYATAFVQRLNLIKQSILPNYLYIPEPPAFTFDSFVGIQRLITVQVTFNLIVPTNCEVTVQRIIDVIGNAFASGVASATLFSSTSVSTSVTGSASVFADLSVSGKTIIEIFANVFASGNATANITKVININANPIINSTATGNAIVPINIAANVNATGEINAVAQIGKNISATALGTAFVNAELTVTTKGIVLVAASVNATATADGVLSRIISVQSDASTLAETSAIATLTKVLEANATATAQTNASAQLTIPVNASATATAQTSANAQLSYTVNAEANATAQTSAEAQIIRIISASATATAESTAEASFGITFNANVTGSANVEAVAARTATMVASVNASGEASAVLKIAKNVAASVTASALVTNATLQVQAVDPYFANVSLLLHGNGSNGSTVFTDNSLVANTVTGHGNAQISTAQSKFGGASILFDGQNDAISFPTSNAFNFGSGDWTVELFYYRAGSPQEYARLFQTTNQDVLSAISIVHNLTSNTIIVTLSNSNQVIALSIIVNTDVTNNAFNHIALVRSGSNIYFYLNGTRQVLTSSFNSTLFFNTNESIALGGNSTGQSRSINGYLDEVRVTKGVARYTGATLSVPTVQFPDQ